MVETPPTEDGDAPNGSKEAADAPEEEAADAPKEEATDATGDE